VTWLGLAIGCATIALGPNVHAYLTGTASVQTVSAPAELFLTPRVIRIDEFTCAELLALPAESNDRMLIFFNGFMAGLQQRTTWDERVEGMMVEGAVAYCRANPTSTVLSAFLHAEP